jgi:hypothetical protein
VVLFQPMNDISPDAGIGQDVVLGSSHLSYRMPEVTSHRSQPLSRQPRDQVLDDLVGAENLKWQNVTTCHLMAQVLEMTFLIARKMDQCM